MKKKGKAKRIAALAGVVVLFSLYLFSFVAAILAKPYKEEVFVVSLYGTVIIPVLIYGFMVVCKAFGRKEGEISLRELRKMNKELKNMPEELEKEDKNPKKG